MNTFAHPTVLVSLHARRLRLAAVFFGFRTTDGVLDEMYGGDGGGAGSDGEEEDEEEDSDEEEDAEMMDEMMDEMAEEGAEPGQERMGGGIKHEDFFGDEGDG